MEERKLVVAIVREKETRDTEPLEEGKVYSDAGGMQALE